MSIKTTINTLASFKSHKVFTLSTIIVCSLLSGTQIANAIPFNPLYDTVTGDGVTVFEYYDGFSGHYSVDNNSQHDIFGFAISSGRQFGQPTIDGRDIEAFTPYDNGWSAQQITRDSWSDSTLGGLGSFSSFFGDTAGEDFVSYYFFDEARLAASHQQESNDWTNSHYTLIGEQSSVQNQLNDLQGPPPFDPNTEILSPLDSDFLVQLYSEFQRGAILLPDQYLFNNGLNFPSESNFLPLPFPPGVPIPLSEFGILLDILLAYHQGDLLQLDLDPRFQYFWPSIVNSDYFARMDAPPFDVVEEQRLLDRLLEIEGALQALEANPPAPFMINPLDYAITAGTSVGDGIQSPFRLSNFLPGTEFIALGQGGSVVGKSFAPNATDVPEPTTVAIFGLALTGLALSRRKK